MRRALLLVLAGCTGGSTKVFEVGATAPSLTGLVETPACVASVTDLGVVWCVTTDGKVQWHTEVCRPVRQRPAVVGGSLFVACESGEWTALDVKTGKPRWKLSGRRVPAGALVSDGLYAVVASADGTAEGVDEAGASLWVVAGAGTRLAVSSELVAVSSDAGVSVLEAATGARRFGDPAPAIALAGSEVRVFAAHASGDVVAFDAQTGAKAWGVTLGAMVNDALSAESDSVWVGLSTGEVVELAAADGAERSRTKLTAPLAAPVRYGIAVVSGREGCAVVLKGGTTVCAAHQLRGPAVLRDGVLLLGPRDGRVLGFRIKP